MISSLSISNYALIRQLALAPDGGLNIITGETGAGKSIILGAVGLLLGKRADTKALLDTEKKCMIEGEFDLSGKGLKLLFEEEDIEYDDHSILRREISPKGKSRAFINDMPVTLDLMKRVGLRLVDIHSQNESIQLGDKLVKVKIFDDYAQTINLLEVFRNDFDAHGKLTKRLDQLQEQQKEAQKDSEYKKYLLEELISAQLVAEEQSGMEEELTALSNAEEIKLKLSQLSNEFDVSEPSINDRLREAVVVLRNVSAFSKDLEILASRFESATEEILDVVNDVTAKASMIEHDPERIELLTQRLDLINKLLQKHQVNEVSELIEISANLEIETEGVLNLSEEIEGLKTAVEVAYQEMIQSAERLSEERRKHIDQFSSEVNKLLAEVGMPDGQVVLVYKRVEPWRMGIDEVEFLFSANKGINPEPVSNVASGGEFSRLMFCVKYMLADKTAMPTVIFDEIDTGVSGEIAMKMAVMMKRMSKSHQIIAISHLPQIAARGESHYFVYKNNQAATTESLIKKLDKEERLEEIAKMIGGEKPSEMARNSARELIEMK